MSISGLTLIGERINPGFARSKALIEGRDVAALQELARQQAAKGARYLTVNLGEAIGHSPEFLREVITALQAAVDLPLSFDHPDRAVQEIFLEAYDPAKARGAKPIVNSMSELRLEMLDLLGRQPFRLVLMVSERLESGQGLPNVTPSEMLETAKRLVDQVLSRGNGMSLDDILVDVALCPLASDTDGQVARAIEAIHLIGSDPALGGIHLLVGLSNLGILLPKLASDGSRLNVKLESAFLTLTMPYGLDTILGTPGREYQVLPENDFVFCGFREVIAATGGEALARLRKLYRPN